MKLLLFWKLSVAVLVAANAADAVSSHGMIESNPILGRGVYSDARGALLKAGIVGSVILAEHLVIRRHSSAAKPLVIVNLAVAGATGAAAVHNWRLK